MPKQGGLGDQLYVAGYDLSGDIGSLSRIGGGPAAMVITGIDKSGIERIGGVRDGGMEFMSYHNDAAGRSHPILAAQPNTDRILSYGRGTLLGSPGAGLVAKQLSYDGTRNADGSLTYVTKAEANGYGIEWGRQLTAGRRTDPGSIIGAGVDFLASTAFGMQAYIQIFAFTGVDATILIQGSNDNAVADPYTEPVGGFSQTINSVTPTAYRLATTGTTTIKRWFRIATVTTGGFTNLQFAVTVVKNETAVAF